ncbi:AIPR family protein [Helicobacter ailurogastricus]|uniref:AIPR family protein n=1 Tax=Helicobacter ailurogastricus TaxID=1578720 RepID=UPI0022C9365E|nr:AIPR family protein [Helicobacter ailurogastricus]GLH58237.1 hypothetical protein NHP214376_10270 [Helicobacter ailurogastricus]GLH59109.1 hypothetical protein NHP214377_03730 [Helicobacter ailurogastricus]
MFGLEEFHQDFMQRVAVETQSRGMSKHEAFIESIRDELVKEGELSESCELAEYNKKDMEVCGYAFDEERGELSLLVSCFFQSDTLQTLTKAQIDSKFKKLKTFLKGTANRLYESMEEGFTHHSMAYNIYTYLSKNMVEKVRLILITDGRATKNLLTIPNETKSSIEIEHCIRDMEYLYRMYKLDDSSNGFEVEVNLPVLVVKTPTEEYNAYLSVVDGTTLKKIYEDYGSRLLEQNIRTFLQFKGNVNKGIRNTIEYEPEMFFAYNNGITATASGVVVENGKIKKISNFQIVNGGQTIASIYAASKKIDVSKVYTQMKLSVVANESKQDAFVSKVSEYANTQNKVNKSDFFSNSPFHRDFKEYSKSVLAPAIDGTQMKTHWFYERVRGEYLTEQMYLTSKEKNQFLKERPKSQLVDKSLLAKSEVAWLQAPYVVSNGAQDSFKKFAKHITETLKKDEFSITENYFKEAIARIIMFRQTEKIVSQANWYASGYRTPCVAYTLAYLSHYLEQRSSFLNFMKIWEEQKVSAPLQKILAHIAPNVYTHITNPPIGNTNALQWCRTKLCWEHIEKIDFNLEIDEGILTSAEEQKYINKEAKKDKKRTTDMEKWIFVTGFKHWPQVLAYYQREDLAGQLSTQQMDILSKMVAGVLNPPSEKQAKILYELYENAINEGLVIQDCLND